MGGFGPDLAQIASAIPHSQSQQAPTTGASTSVTNPTSPFDDLQNKADAIRQQQVMQDLQNRAAAISPPTQPGQLSQDNPYASMVADYSSKVKQSSPDSTPKHGVKGFLSNFFQGAGDAMLTRVGMPTPYQLRQTDLQNFERISQIASQWESQLQVLNGVSLTRGHGYRGWMHFRLKSVNQADIKRVRLDIWLLDQLDR